MYYAKQTEQGFHITVLKVLFPETSFPETGPDLDWLANSGVYPVEEYLYFDAEQYKRNAIEPELQDGLVYTAELILLTEDEKLLRKSENISQLASRAREQRNRLLAESDWTQVSDAPVDNAVWANYRQELRNITRQPNFPDNITWPTKP